MSGQRPFVSVLTPTYNRSYFIPAIIQCYKNQTYPKDRMEWIILDDGTEPIADFFTELSKSCPNIRYIHQEGPKVLIGAKRNRLMKEARGDIFVWMDDDDFYFPDRVAHAVMMLQRQPKVQLAGSSQIFMYYFDTGKIHSFGPLHQKHATNGTMAIRKEYARTHTYDETVTHAEEKSFLDDYKHDMVQLDSYKTMLVMAHSSNTFDKRNMRDRKTPTNISGAPVMSLLKETTLKLKDFIRTAGQRNFYEGLRLKPTPAPASESTPAPATEQESAPEVQLTSST